MARYINKYATLTDYNGEADARNALGDTVSLIKELDSVHYDKGNVGPTPGPGPTPSYNYILLNNFITPMPEPRKPYESQGVSSSDNFINTVPSEWPDSYQTNDLVLSTHGDQLLDDASTIDFSSKNIPAGTPFGIVTSDSCPLGEGPSYAISSSSVSNGCTIEMWYKSSYTWNVQDNAWLVSIGHKNGISDAYPKLLLTINGNNMSGYAESIPEYYAMLRLSTESNTRGTDYNATVSIDWANGIWHHYALTYDASTNFVHFFLDGHKVKSITDATNDIRELFTTVSYIDFLSSNGSDLPKGRTAQIAVCDQCKWTEDFEVPTVAY
jgi:hypothetical protein